MADARFRVSFGAETMEIDGESSFVDAQLERLAPAISARIAPNGQVFAVPLPPAAPPAPIAPAAAVEAPAVESAVPIEPVLAAEPPAAAEPAPPVEPPPPPEPPAPEPLDVSHIFRVTDRGQLQIIPDIPGRSRPEQIANTARLLGLGVERCQGLRTVSFATLRAACKAHGCSDEKNLIWALRKRGRGAFIVGGRKRRQTLALTESGRAEAEALIRSLSAPSPTEKPLSPA